MKSRTRPQERAVEKIADNTLRTRGKAAKWLFCAVVGGVALQTGTAHAQSVTATVSTGSKPYMAAVNTVTNKIYVPDYNANTVTVIDGASNTVTATIPVGMNPIFAAVNSVTNKIYVADLTDNDVYVIDGATNATVEVPVGTSPAGIAINPLTNKIYVSNGGSDNVTVIDGATNTTTNIPVGTNPGAIAVNTATNRIYVANFNNGNDSTVTVINGATNGTTSVTADAGPSAIAINSSTNQIYVTNRFGGDVTVINGANNHTTTVTAGANPIAIAVNPVTNVIYAVNYNNGGPGSLTVINGSDNSTATVAVGAGPISVGFNSTTNQIYVVNNADGTLSAINGNATNGVNLYQSTTVAMGSSPSWVAVNENANLLYVSNQSSDYVTVVDTNAAAALQFVPITPCRIADTRLANGPFGGPILAGGTERDFAIPSSTCGIPSTALAYSLNVTAVPNAGLGYLTIWPSGQSQPLASTLNSDGRVKANAVIVPAGVSGGVAVYVSDPSHVVLDINGYFVSGQSSTLNYFPVTPCRIADTRLATGSLGGPSLTGGVARSFPVLSSSCNIPATAKAYSLNLTAVPKGGGLGFLTAWPAGQTRPLVSTLNSPGSVTANAAIIAAGTSGAVNVYASDNTDLVIDISGYFALPSAGGLSLYPLTPCRVVDTRTASGAFVGNVTIDVVDTSCGAASAAQAYVLNATVVPPGELGFLSLWANGASQPLVSTLNSDGSIASNLAIVPSFDGSVSAYASDLTQLILDISGYFAP